MIKRIQNVMEKLENMSLKEIRAWEFLLVALTIADLFGLWYFLGWKRIAGALLIVIIFFLAIFLFYDSRKRQENPKEAKKIEKEEKDFWKDTRKSLNLGKELDFGIESPDSRSESTRLLFI